MFDSYDHIYFRNWNNDNYLTVEFVGHKQKNLIFLFYLTFQQFNILDFLHVLHDLCKPLISEGFIRNVHVFHLPYISDIQNILTGIELSTSQWSVMA